MKILAIKRESQHFLIFVSRLTKMTIYYFEKTGMEL
jgi:hypothetical protein